MENSQQQISPNGKANTIKKTFSRETTVSTHIAADRDIVWNLLTNAADFPRWNSTVVALKGEIEVGQTVELTSTLDESRTFNLKVKEMAPQQRMVWSDRMGSRVYTLDQKDGGVLFSMSEKIGGLMFPLFAGQIPPFDAVFEQFAADLKKEAELIQESH